MTATAEHEHVSPFTLDVYFAAGQVGDPALKAHVEQCSRCQSYLGTLAALRETSAPLPRMPEPIARGAAAHWRWMTAAALAAATALGLGTLRVTGWAESERGSGGDRPAQDLGQHSAARGAPEILSKGMPSAQALIRSAGWVRVHASRDAVRAGDTLAFRVDCAEFDQVALLSVQGGGDTERRSAERLYVGRCDAGSELLPLTLAVDSEPGEERVAVVFSRGSLDDETLYSAALTERRDRSLWVVELAFPKASGEP